MDKIRASLALCGAVAVLQGCAGYGVYDSPPAPQPAVLERSGVKIYVNQGAPTSCTRLGTAPMAQPSLEAQRTSQASVGYYVDMAAAQVKAKGGNAGSVNLDFRPLQQISAPTYGLWPAGDAVVYRC